MPATPRHNYVSLPKAAEATRYTRRYIKKLIDAGAVRAIAVDGIPGDSRVRWVVSLNSLRAYRKRVKGRA